MFQITDLHTAIFAAQNKPGNIALLARAGCGKTSTVIEMMRLVPQGQTIAYVSFGRKNIEDVAGKLRDLGRPVVAKTMHSFGAGALARKFGKRPGDEPRKLQRILKERLSADEAKRFGPSVLQLADKARAVGEVSRAVAERFEITPPVDNLGLPLWERMVEIAQKLIVVSTAQAGKTMDFGDMLYASVKIAPQNFDRFDVVFVDEAQDLSSIQRDMLRCLIKPGGRLISVGDDRQAIYAFRGADSSSFALIVSEFKCKTLPLNRSYRCPKAVAVEARKFVPDFEVAETNDDGVVRRCSLNDFRSKEALAAGDMVICRSNAPVVSAAFALIKRGIPAIVLGRDLADGLLRIVDDLMASSVEDLLGRLIVWSDRAEKRARKSNPDDCDAALETIADKVAVIRAVCENADTVEAVCEKINMVFSDSSSKNCVTLSSVHKVKGAEADRVFILKPDQLPSPKAKTPEALVQEQNLAYVAVTRAKKELVYVDG